MKIYVASSWRNLYQPAIVAALRSLGYEVYDFRNPGNGDNGFSWRSVSPAWESWTPAQWRDALKHPIAQAGYGNDRKGMDWADVCVLVLPSGRSAHMEAAFMAAQGKPAYTLALEKVEPDLMNLLLGPPDHILTTMNELFDAMETAAANFRGPNMIDAGEDDDAACESCRGYGYFDENGNPTIDKRGRKCLDCTGTGIAARNEAKGDQ